MDRTIAIGTDIGGSHISCAAVDLVSGKVLKDTRSERAVNNQAHASEIISTWTEALSGSLSRVPADKVKGVGFAMPGPFDYVKGICYIKGVAKYENLYGFNITDAIASSLGAEDNFLIRFMNDVSAFAVGEAFAGKTKEVDRSMAVTLGTGFGSAFISNKIPIVDGPEVPKLGCVYHLPYKESIADDYFSTRWFIRRYKNATGKELSGVRELSQLVTDRVVLDLFAEFGNDLAAFLAPWLIKFQAEKLVMGGNISYAYDLFGSIFEERLIKEGCRCEVVLSSLKEDAALLGSAYLLDDEFWNKIQHALPLM